MLEAILPSLHAIKRQLSAVDAAPIRIICEAFKLVCPTGLQSDTLVVRWLAYDGSQGL